MNKIYSKALHRLETYDKTESNILEWASPILFFGKLKTAKIATVGLNPSNKEFLDNHSTELNLEQRRFHTLDSLNLGSWKEAGTHEIRMLIKSCEEYFNNNPYNTWFKRLDYIVSGSSKSYYFPSQEVCHLDLIPFATKRKWGELSNFDKNILLNRDIDILKDLLAESEVTYLILNGRSVVKYFEKAFGIHLDSYHNKSLDLIRNNSAIVKGICYEGMIKNLDGDTNKTIHILGYNHNIQSSFGISSQVMKELRNWITSKIKL